MTQTGKLKVSEILEDVIDLLHNPKRWTKGTYARLEDGEVTEVCDPKACQFCIAGAIRRVTPSAKEERHKARTLVYELLPGKSLAGFNDDVETTHADIMSLLVKALGIARERERKNLL